MFSRRAFLKLSVTSAGTFLVGRFGVGRAFAVPVKSGSGKLYRARFGGFDATAANETCSRLKTMQIDCFVIHSE